MSWNDLAFVRQTMQVLHHRGIITWLFGGWAEEVLGLAPPRQHHDPDLLYPVGKFGRGRCLLAGGQDLTAIPAKHLPHKHAFVRLGIMTELILLRPVPGPAWITDFWNQGSYQWARRQA